MLNIKNIKDLSKARVYISKKIKKAKLFLLGPLFNFLYFSFVLLEHLRIRINGTQENQTWLIDKRLLQQKKELDLVICVPVGPGEVLGIVDLIESAKCYLDGRYRFVVVDDSGSLEVWRAVRKYSEVDYLRNWRRRGFRKLPQTIRKCYRYALQNYQFPFILKIDADALITGPGLIHDIKEHVTRHPKAGMLGSYRITSENTTREFSLMGDILKENWIYWKEIIEKAQRFGYELGENTQGGAYVITRPCLEDMQRAGYLIAKPRGTVYVEDVTFSLYSRSLGYELHDFAKVGQPFAIAWRGLPIPKEEVVKQGKKVIHSVKYATEDIQIRDYFRKIREKDCN